MFEEAILNYKTQSRHVDDEAINDEYDVEEDEAEVHLHGAAAEDHCVHHFNEAVVEVEDGNHDRKYKVEDRNDTEHLLQHESLGGGGHHWLSHPWKQTHDNFTFNILISF